MTHKLEQYAKDKKVDEFLSSFSHLDTYSMRLNSLMYLDELNEDFLFKNYLTHWPADIKSTDGLNMEDKFTILNFNIRFLNQ